MLIPASVIAVLSVMATIVMLLKRHYESAFTRFCVMVFYIALALTPMDIELARVTNRWLWALVLGVESLWWISWWTFRRWRKQ